MRNPRGTLWLHAGTHKTGTTSIQQAIARRKNELRALGVAIYPEPNAWRLASHFIRPDLSTTPRLQGLPVPVLTDFDQVSREVAAIRGPDTDDLIISSEEFCLLRHALEAHAFRSVLGSGFSRIVTILVARNVRDWRAAREDQLRKTRVWDAHKALPDALSADGSWYYDTASIRAFWRDLGEVRDIDFDAACRHDGSILPAFGRAIDRPGMFDDLDLRLNQRGRAAP